MGNLNAETIAINRGTYSGADGVADAALVLFELSSVELNPDGKVAAAALPDISFDEISLVDVTSNAGFLIAAEQSNVETARTARANDLITAAATDIIVSGTAVDPVDVEIPDLAVDLVQVNWDVEAGVENPDLAATLDLSYAATDSNPTVDLTWFDFKDELIVAGPGGVPMMVYGGARWELDDPALRII